MLQGVLMASETLLSPEIEPNSADDIPDPHAGIWLDKVEIEPGSAPAAILDLAYCQCRFPLELRESSGSFFCTEMRESFSRPYCAAHNQLCTRTVEPGYEPRLGDPDKFANSAPAASGVSSADPAHGLTMGLRAGATLTPK
jgi:hypothetical protein